MDTGIYTITAPSGNFYIGSTTRSFKTRWMGHRSDLKHQRHRNIALQSAWNKYGGENMQFAVLWECEPENCRELEQFLMQEMQPEYNISKDTLAPFLGRQHTQETKDKQRIGHLGKKKPPLSDEHKKKLSDYFTGIKHPPRSAEYREKQSIAQKKRIQPIRTTEWRQNMSLSRKGKPFSEEHKKNISLSRIGKYTGSANNSARAVVCIENNMQFCTMKDAASWVSGQIGRTIKHQNICSVCRGKLKSAYGYTWKYK